MKLLSVLQTSLGRYPSDDLSRRHRRLMEQAATLSQQVPEMADDVRYRMQLVQFGMDKLDAVANKRRESSASSGDEHAGKHSALALRLFFDQYSAPRSLGQSSVNLSHGTAVRCQRHEQVRRKSMPHPDENRQ